MAIVQVKLTGKLTEQITEEAQSEDVEIIKAVTERERQGTPSEQRVRSKKLFYSDYLDKVLKWRLFLDSSCSWIRQYPGKSTGQQQFRT